MARPYLAALALLSIGGAGGCGLIPTAAAPKEPVSIAVVQGDNQITQAGRALASPIVLRVLDESGHGLAKQTITVVVTSGGGTVTPATAVTDSLGELRLNWTLGTATVTQQLLATVKDAVIANLVATAIYPTSIVLAQGGAQSGKTATALKNDVVVRIVGPNNLPMIGVPVSFSVAIGGGALAPPSGVTNSLGEFSAKWTLGAAVGPNLLVVSSGSLAQITIPATATP